MEGVEERPATVAHTTGVPYLHAAEGLSPRDRGSSVVSNHWSGRLRQSALAGPAVTEVANPSLSSCHIPGASAAEAAVVEGAEERSAAVAHTAGVPYLHAAEGISPRGRGSGIVSNP